MDFLFLYGTPDDGLGRSTVVNNGELQHEITGTSNIGPFLNSLTAKKHTFYLSGSEGAQNYNFNFFPTLIFNELSDPDSHINALKRAVAFCDQQQCPVFNHPRFVQLTRRDHIYDRLNHIKGLIVPKTIHFTATSPADVKNALRKNNLNYPVIFRKAGDHGGISTTLLKNTSQIIKAMYPYALDGSAFYATEFTDFASEDGNYRKYRIAVVEGRPYLRHMIISDSWLIHSSSREHMKNNPALQEEEAKLLVEFDETLRPKVIDAVDEITRTLQLDYYGIDCSIDAAGNMLAFEINPNMNILINNQQTPNIWEVPIANIINHVSDLVMRKAMEKTEDKPKRNPQE